MINKITGGKLETQLTIPYELFNKLFMVLLPFHPTNLLPEFQINFHIS